MSANSVIRPRHRHEDPKTRHVLARWLMGLIVGLVFLQATGALAASRIKDIADFEGVRDNMLIGYGLVVGLNGTGDTLRNAPFTLQSLQSMLERLGVNVREANLSTQNVAAVMVTANLPPFSKQGTRIDVTVSTMGDADNLLGGTLLVTPMLGADGEVYAVAQGPVTVAGFSAKGEGGTVTKGVPTSGRISNGAIIEREIIFDLEALPSVTVSLRNPDFTTAHRVAEAVNQFLGATAARATDPGSVRILPPESHRGRIVELLTEVEQLRVEPDQVARVVIDESSGVIVIGDEVRVDEVAIAQGNLTVRVSEAPQVSQPNAFAQAGETAAVPRTDIQIDEDEDKKLIMLKTGVSLQDLVDGLNGLGVGPRDLISILQTIKSAGALQAEIVVQ